MDSLLPDSTVGSNGKHRSGRQGNGSLGELVVVAPEKEPTPKATQQPAPDAPDQIEGGGTSSEFEWTETDAVLFHGCESIACYQNPHGDIVIRQQQTWDRDEDSLVIVPQMYAEFLAGEINKLCSEAWPNRFTTRHEGKAK